MENIKIQVRLSKLLLTSPEEIVTKADDVKMIPDFRKCEDGIEKLVIVIE